MNSSPGLRSPGTTARKRRGRGAHRRQAGVKCAIRAGRDNRAVEDQRAGAALRALRLRRNWRQSDVAARARVSASTVSRLERGHPEKLSLATIRAVGAALDLRFDLVPRWRGGDLDRLLNARHSAMHEAVARMFGQMPAWSVAAEVSFAVYAERGVVDVLAWHAGARVLLVVELKTELVDVQEVLGTLDRKRRLAPVIGRERGWVPAQVGTWLLLAESTTNRDRVRAHGAVLRGACPAGGLEIRRWLAAPAGPIRALSFLAAPQQAGGSPRPGLRDGHGRNAMSPFASRKRVRRPRDVGDAGSSHAPAAIRA